MLIRPVSTQQDIIFDASDSRLKTKHRFKCANNEYFLYETKSFKLLKTCPFDRSCFSGFFLNHYILYHGDILDIENPDTVVGSIQDKEKYRYFHVLGNNILCFDTSSITVLTFDQKSQK